MGVHSTMIDKPTKIDSHNRIKKKNQKIIICRTRQITSANWKIVTSRYIWRFIDIGFSE